MSCYFRHIKDVFEEVGVEVTPANKKDIDRTIHELVGVPYKDCPATWRKVKQRFLADDRKRGQFVRILRRALK